MQLEKQIPCGNDSEEKQGQVLNIFRNERQKGQDRSRFPSGMTDRKARAGTRAGANTEADSLLIV
jgi:hypothetical protein